MPNFDHHLDQPKKAKVIKSAFESESFESDGIFQVSGLVGAATISPCGRDVALASPDGLAIIDLDSPYNPPRRLRSHGLPWLVVDVQWSPFAARDYWVVSTANHRALVWNLNLRDDGRPGGAVEHSLQGHSRAITDVNFSAHHPDILATCAVDGYVHSWDLRRPRQPALSFCDWFAGATQVKYNRQQSHLLASCHDRLLHIWDERRACEPLKSISAHASKIYGLDWNRTSATRLVTCSLDRTIKFWDYTNEDNVPERMIRTEFPVWRARHTPFGTGLLAMPQNEPGDLYLYNWAKAGPTADRTVQPAAVFQGHGNHKAREFLWRNRGEVDNNIDDREFQLVSWGEDKYLRLQVIDPEILESVGYAKGGPPVTNLNLTRKGAIYKSFRTVDDNPNRDKRNATMSDPRAGMGTHHYRHNSVSTGLRPTLSQYPSSGTTPWRGPSMKAKTPSRREPDRSQLQIGWMKGITLVRRNTTKVKGPNDEGVFSPVYPDNEWGEPDTVQDELLRISHRLPKVKWEHIDMDTLTLKASLNGPWGANEDMIFLKVTIDIPTSYPKHKAPDFMIEKTSFMTDETYQRLDRELEQLAHKFLARKQNSLEVAFTYLLGEVDLETSTSFFKNVRDLDDDDDGLADESSSEESDNEIPTGGSASMSQELVPNVDETNPAIMAPTHVLAAPLPPALCGARFSPDGRLVCFFPSKEEKARASTMIPAESLRERNKNEPVFAGFGRLQDPSSRRYDDSSGSDHSSESDDDTSSSSDSESTSMHKISSLWYTPGRRLRKAWSENRSMRSSDAGTGAGTGTGTGTGVSRRKQGKPKTIVSIHDMRGDLPSRKEFAKEYAIFGDGVNVCEHNAAVTRKYGASDLADVWAYLAMLLREGIPLELVDHHHRRESVLVIARRVVAGSRNNAPGTASRTISELSGRVKWGSHPLAKDFIKDLFGYYEKIADIQMLAMLSCIFSESPPNDDSVIMMGQHLSQPETPIPLKAPSFSLDYFPADASFWVRESKMVTGRSTANTSAITTPRTVHTPVYFSGSQVSDDGVWMGDAASNSFSCGETPPPPRSVAGRDIMPSGGVDHLADLVLSRSHSNSRAHSHYHSFPHGLSSSVDAKPFRMTSGLIASKQLSHVMSSSPPGVRKRPSPADMTGNPNNLTPTNVTWSMTATMGDSAGTGRTLRSEDDLHEEVLPPLVPYGVSVLMEDQTKFDDDGWMMVPVLEPSKNDLYSAWRYSYSEMLQMWGEPLSRLEILKFNVLEEALHPPPGAKHDHGRMPPVFTVAEAQPARSTHSTQHSPSPVPMNKKDDIMAILASGRGLDVIGICFRHETQLDPLPHPHPLSSFFPSSSDDVSSIAGADANPALVSGGGGAVGSCRRCRKVQTQLKCVYCLEPIDALYSPCLACGCASHEDCLAEWHAAGEVLCPAGDQCNCIEEASNGQIESWAAIMGYVGKTTFNPRASVAAERASRPSLGSANIFAKSDVGNEEPFSQRSEGAAVNSELLSPLSEEPGERRGRSRADSSRWSHSTAPGGLQPRTVAQTLAPIKAERAEEPSSKEQANDSPAKVSLGNRLRKAGNWSRAQSRRGSLERKAGSGT